MFSRRSNRHGRRSTSVRMPAEPAERRLPPELERRIDNDPVFQVITLDQQHWIEPYGGKAVPASLGRARAAREFLLGTEVWRQREPLSLSRLEYERWRLDLIRMLPLEPRLRIFSRRGWWLNPYNGAFAESIGRDDGKISLRTVSQMAELLRVTSAARSGQMLDMSVLVQKAKEGSNSSTTSIFAKPQVLDEAMEKARSVQQNMLGSLPKLDGFELAVHYRAHHGVSGDFYDALTLPDGRILLVIGDVSGHGMQAALVVATALKTLRFLARESSDLIGLLVRFNDEIKRDLLPGQFMTMFAGALDARTGSLACVRAGHHPGLVVNMGQESILRRLGRSGMAIGLAPGSTFASTLREDTVELLPGDVLVQYTDGLVEAMSPDEREYGEARLCGSLLAHIEDAPQALVDGLAEDVSRFANGPVGDDITILALIALAPRAAEPIAELIQGTPVESDEDGLKDEAEPDDVVADRDESSPHETGEIEAQGLAR